MNYWQVLSQIWGYGGLLVFLLVLFSGIYTIGKKANEDPEIKDSKDKAGFVIFALFVMFWIAVFYGLTWPISIPGIAVYNLGAKTAKENKNGTV